MILCKMSIVSRIAKKGLRRVFRYSFPSIREMSSDTGEEHILLPDIKEVKIPKTTICEHIYSKCKDFGDFTAIECGLSGKKYTYNELRKKCNNLSNSLRSILKLQKGDTVAVLLPNMPDFPIAILGSLEASLVVTTLNTLYTAEEIARQLEDSSAKAIITLVDFFPNAKSATTNLKKQLPIITIKSRAGQSIPSGSINFDDFINNSVKAPEADLGKHDDLVLLPYSSGTTGLPKGVELTNYNIVSNLVQSTAPEVHFLKSPLDGEQIITIGVLPMFHIYGLTITLLHMLSHGCKIITLPKFVPEWYLSQLEKHKPQVLFAAPPLILFLMGHPNAKPEFLSRTTHILSGAAPLGALDEQRFMKKFGSHFFILQGYGLTETSPSVALTRPDLIQKLNTSGSIGKSLPNTYLKIAPIDDPSGSLGPNQPGELLVKGPQVTRGYYNKPQQTKEAFHGEWFRTGDLMYYNEDKLLFVTDRLKELIKVKGFQVAPAELEEIVRDFPSVADVAVIGVPHELHGEVPRAYVVPKPNSKINVDDLKEFVAKKVAPYKQLLGGVSELNAIPKNATGKILRRELKMMYEKENQ